MIYATHHIQIGERVRLIGLKSQRYNQQMGFVQDFIHDTERYAVKLVFSGDVKSFKGCNIENIPQYPQPLSLSKKCCDLINNASSLEDLQKARTIIEENFAENTFMLITYANVLIDQRFHASALREGLQMMLHCEQYADEGLEKVMLTHMIGELYCHLGMPEQAKETLLSIVDSHRGQLLGIVSSLANVLSTTEGLRPLLERCERTVLKSGNYDPTSDDVGFFRRLFSIRAYDAIEAEYSIQSMKCVENVMKNLLEVIPDPLDSSLERGILQYLKEEYVDALKNLTQAQERVGTTYGIGSITFVNALQWKQLCYQALGDEKKAKACFRLCKRQYAGYHGKEFPEMTNKTRGRELPEVDVKSICSNPKCNKVETAPKQFKSCARCKSVVYCSRKCQQWHYKHGHKVFCKKKCFPTY